MWQHVSTCALRDWPGRDLARIDATLTLVHDTITPVILDAECEPLEWFSAGFDPRVQTTLALHERRQSVAITAGENERTVIFTHRRTRRVGSKGLTVRPHVQ